MIKEENEDEIIHVKIDEDKQVPTTWIIKVGNQIRTTYDLYATIMTKLGIYRYKTGIQKLNAWV